MQGFPNIYNIGEHLLIGIIISIVALILLYKIQKKVLATISIVIISFSLSFLRTNNSGEQDFSVYIIVGAFSILGVYQLFNILINRKIDN